MWWLIAAVVVLSLVILVLLLKIRDHRNLAAGLWGRINYLEKDIFHKNLQIKSLQFDLEESQDGRKRAEAALFDLESQTAGEVQLALLPTGNTTVDYISGLISKKEAVEQFQSWVKQTEYTLETNEKYKTKIGSVI